MTDRPTGPATTRSARVEFMDWIVTHHGGQVIRVGPDMDAMFDGIAAIAERREQAQRARILAALPDVIAEHTYYSGDDFNPSPVCECGQWHSWSKKKGTYPDHVVAALAAAIERVLEEER